MSRFEESVIIWAHNELKIKLNPNDISSLLQSKNSAVYQKLFSFVTQHFKSKSNAKAIKTTVAYQKLNVKLQELHEEIDELKRDIKILSVNREKDEYESTVKKLNSHNKMQREHLLNTLFDILDGISIFRCNNTSLSNFNHGFNFGDLPKSSLKEIVSEVNSDSSLSENLTPKQMECSRLTEQMNEMVKTINGVLYEISNIELPTFENVDWDQLLHLLCNHSCNDKRENKPVHGEHFDTDRFNKVVDDLNNTLNAYKQHRSLQLQSKIEKITQALTMCEEILQMRLKC